MTNPPDFEAGQELTSGLLNELGSAGSSAALSLDGSSGLVGWSLPSGSAIRNQRRPEGWYKITGTASGGGYALLEQVDKPGGTWADGVRTVTAWPTPGSAAVVADGSKIVRAWRGNAVWLFEFGACP